MLVMIALALAGRIVLNRIRIQNGVAPIFEDIAMKLVRARLHHGVHGAAPRAPILRIVCAGLYLELLNGFDVRRNLPAAVYADRSTVQQELVSTAAAAVNAIRAVDVPSAGPGEAVGSKLLLRENDAGRQFHKHVSLTAIQWQLLRFDWIEHQAAVRIFALNQLLLAGDRDLLRHLAYLQRDR